MPNIEIHGYGSVGRAPGDARVMPDQGLILRDKIKRLFLRTSYGREVVVTLVDDYVVDLDSRWRPFLRVVSTPQDYVADVIERLKTLDMDIEYLKLAAFYPAPDPKVAQ